MGNIDNITISSPQWSNDEKSAETAVAASRSTQTEPEKNAEEPIREEIDMEKVVKSVQNAVKAFSTSLSFSIDEITGQQVIVVRDRDSGKTIRQIPSEEMLRLSRTMNAIAGIIFHEEA